MGSRGNAGDALVLTGFPGDAGAFILAEEARDALLSRFSDAYLRRTRDVLGHLCPDTALEVLARFGARTEMLRDGGIFAALFRFSEADRVGFTVSLRAVPLHQETVEICNELDINPYKLYSAGCVLAAVADGDGALSALHAAGIPASRIGTVEAGCRKNIVNGTRTRCLERPGKDPLVMLGLAPGRRAGMKDPGDRGTCGSRIRGGRSRDCGTRAMTGCAAEGGRDEA